MHADAEPQQTTKSVSQLSIIVTVVGLLAICWVNPWVTLFVVVGAWLYLTLFATLWRKIGQVLAIVFVFGALLILFVLPATQEAREAARRDRRLVEVDYQCRAKIDGDTSNWNLEHQLTIDSGQNLRGLMALYGIENANSAEELTSTEFKQEREKLDTQEFLVRQQLLEEGWTLVADSPEPVETYRKTTNVSLIQNLFASTSIESIQLANVGYTYRTPESNIELILPRFWFLESYPAADRRQNLLDEADNESVKIIVESNHEVRIRISHPMMRSSVGRAFVTFIRTGPITWLLGGFSAFFGAFVSRKIVNPIGKKIIGEGEEAPVDFSVLGAARRMRNETDPGNESK